MINKYKGCLLGLAAGDALGAPVEFRSLQKIREKYGKKGIADFENWKGFKAGSYSDDTQMSLATAVGCILGYQNWRKTEVFNTVSMVYRKYLEWFESQNDSFQRRFPGNTTLSALESGQMGTTAIKINNSKGCGGVMRTAPVGLAFPNDMAFREGVKFAAITHGHPSGYLPAGFLSEMITHLAAGKTLRGSIKLSITLLKTFEGHEETLNKIKHARKLSSVRKNADKAIQELGGGWVGEEALAIALYCALIHENDFKNGVLAAVNHSGDSDSTGSITGALLGTLNGNEAIPKHWILKLENSENIIRIAEDMFRLFKKGEMLSFDKYPS